MAHLHIDELLAFEKLLSIFPCVLSVKITNAEIANVEQATSDSAVDIWVTLAKRSNVGVFKLP